MMRPGSAGSSTAADHLQVTDAAITAVPARYRRRLMVTCDGAGASHKLIARLDELGRRTGRELTYSAGWELGARDWAAIGLVPAEVWQLAIDAAGEVRERRDARNERSARLLERAGFQREGYRPAYTWLKGEWTDDILYGTKMIKRKMCGRTGNGISAAVR